ncbi:MAG: acyltransferase [Planctomycetota bacterium]
MKRVTRDNLPHKVHCAMRLAARRLSTLRAYAAAKWWGVRLGDSCWFHGRTYFRRHPGSRIVVGAGCGFNSAANSNLIGVNRPCMMSTLAQDAVIEIGKTCGFSGTVIGCASKVTLGDNVRCGANTLITDTDWHGDDLRTGKDAPVVIEDDVWLGVNVTVLKGVTIGRGTLIGANSLVTRSLPADVVAAGAPARIIRRISGEPFRDKDISPLSTEDTQ